MRKYVTAIFYVLLLVKTKLFFLSHLKIMLSKKITLNVMLIISKNWVNKVNFTILILI